MTRKTDRFAEVGYRKWLQTTGKLPELRNQRGMQAFTLPDFALKSRWWDLNPQPPLYESGALPLSYIGTICEQSDTHATVNASSVSNTTTSQNPGKPPGD